MTLWAALDLDELAPGANITAANTGNFFDLGYPAAGNLVAAAVAGGGIGMRPRSTGSANFAKNLAGHTAEGRIGWKIQFISVGAATSYFEQLMLRTGNIAGGTIIGDVGLRNVAGAREMAARNNFAYIGQANGNPILPNEQWSVEAHWVGSTFTVYVWDSPITTGPPTYTWGPATMPSTPGNALFGPDTSDSVDAIIYDLWFTDGERRDGDEEPPHTPGTLSWIGNWDARHDRVQVVGKVAGALQVSLILDGVTVNTAPDASSYFRIDLAGLDASTEYSWELLVDGVSRRTGTISTLPAPGIRTGTHRIILGSCLDAYNSGVFALIAAREPDLVFFLGDRGYTFITGGVNGNTSPLTAAELRPMREEYYTTTAARSLVDYAFPLSYMYSDCDGGGANSDGTTGGLATGAVQQVYRQQTANVALPLASSAARSFVVGPFRYIVTDETTAASPKADPDVPGKSKLGTEQLAWFLAELEAAAAAQQAVIWLGDGPFPPPTTSSGTTNEWSRYNAERSVIIAKIQETGVRILRANGDRHALAADSGVNNAFGGFPTVNAAPFHTTANPYGMAASHGTWPPSQTNSSRQYATLDLDHDTMSVTVHGYSSTVSAPTEVDRLLVGGNPLVVDLSYDPVDAPFFVEWDGVSETVLVPIEWNGTTETVLTMLETTEGGEDPVFATSNFLGGAPGTPVTAATEPAFTARDGLSLVYAAAPFGAAGAMMIQSSSGAMALNVAGRSRARFRFYVTRDVGTQTAGMLAILFADAGGTNIADAFFRNQGGGQWALRRNFAYQGQAPVAHAENETWRVEAWYVNGQEIGLALWAPADINNLYPTYQWVTAITQDVITVRFGNATGATGLVQRWSYFVATASIANPIGPVA